jgi:hypothetical protein
MQHMSKPADEVEMPVRGEEALLIFDYIDDFG